MGRDLGDSPSPRRLGSLVRCCFLCAGDLYTSFSVNGTRAFPSRSFRRVLACSGVVKPSSKAALFLTSDHHPRTSSTRSLLDGSLHLHSTRLLDALLGRRDGPGSPMPEMQQPFRDASQGDKVFTGDSKTSLASGALVFIQRWLDRSAALIWYHWDPSISTCVSSPLFPKCGKTEMCVIDPSFFVLTFLVRPRNVGNICREFILAR